MLALNVLKVINSFMWFQGQGIVLQKHPAKKQKMERMQKITFSCFKHGCGTVIL